MIATTRILRDDPTKVRSSSFGVAGALADMSPCNQGDMHNREGLSLKRLWQAVCDYDLWPLYLM